MSKATEVMNEIEAQLDILDSESASWLSKTMARLNTRTAKLSAIGVATVAVTMTVTYFLTAKKLESKYQKIADEEIDDVKRHYAILRKDGADLEELASQYRDEAGIILETEGYLPVGSDEVEDDEDDIPATEDDIAAEIERRAAAVEAEAERAAEEDVIRTVNIFDSREPDTYFDYEEELTRREADPEKPYVITKEEFDANETDFEQTSLTFYDGDQVLTDEKDGPIDDDDSLVGAENLLRFGAGSQDKSIVYVRNERLGLDIEIVQSNGTFTEEVLGFIKHSDDRPRIRKFRNDD